jgi:hypothetical protein
MLIKREVGEREQCAGLDDSISSKHNKPYTPTDTAVLNEKIAVIAGLNISSLSFRLWETLRVCACLCVYLLF